MKASSVKKARAMNRKLYLHKKILSDSQKMLKGEEESSAAAESETPLSRSRSDSLPNEFLLATKLGRRRQSLPTTPQGVDKTEKLLKEGILKLQSSARNCDSAKRTVQDILESRRPSASVDPPPMLHVHPPPPSPPEPPASSNVVSKLGRWMKSKWEEKVSSKSAEKDVKKAVRGVEAAGEVINQMEDSLLKAEEELQARALALRRQSADAFKLVSSGIKSVKIPSYAEEEEEEEGEEHVVRPAKSADPNRENNINEAIKEDNNNSCYRQQITNL